MTQVLIITGSREGHTTKIGHHLAQTMLQTTPNLEYKQLPLTEAISQLRSGRLDLTSFQAIVIGASIHYGHFPKELLELCTKYCNVLQTIPSYFFGVNLTARKPNKCTPESNIYVRKFLAKSPWQPTASAVFAGALNYSQLGWFDRNMIRFIMLLTGGDTDPATNKAYTDWHAVETFAKQITKELPGIQ